MNYIKHLTGFFEKVRSDDSLLPTHISLYMALFQCWNINRFTNPTRISSEDIMTASKIYSRATYHKCLSKLVLLGFLEYQPSKSSYHGSMIIMKNLSLEFRYAKKVDSTYSENEHLTEHHSEHQNEHQTEQLYIYNISKQEKNNSNNSNNDISKKNEIQVVQFLDKRKIDEEEKKSSAKRKEMSTPTLEAVLDHFLKSQVEAAEGKRFFSYYQSKGWLVGSSPMIDWKASAEHWILNMKRFSPNRSELSPGNLQTKTLKNYNEPL